MKGKRVYAFIFARGGSKGLPRKNVLTFGGKPLIAHSIDHAKYHPEVSDVFVSTEDNEIKNIAIEYGARVIERPINLASDEAAEWDAWQHAIRSVEELSEDFDIFLSLPATSPLRVNEDISKALEALTPDIDAVISVTPANRSPYFNMVSVDGNGLCKIMNSSDGFTRRQDVPEAYDITTVFYALKKDFVKTSSKLFDGNVKSVVIPKERAVDIDDEIDFKIAEVFYEGRGS